MTFGGFTTGAALGAGGEGTLASIEVSKRTDEPVRLNLAEIQVVDRSGQPQPVTVADETKEKRLYLPLILRRP